MYGDHSGDHVETFGDHHEGADYESTYHKADHEHRAEPEHWAEPVGDHDYRHEYDDEHFDTPTHGPREVEYGIDDAGHVHMYEEVPEPHGYNFLQ